MANARTATPFRLSAPVTTPATLSVGPQESEDSLTCAICHEVYRTPKLLECTHSFCQHCLHDFVGLASKFNCPMCRREIKVPLGGVAAFRSNPYIRNEDLEKARSTFLCTQHIKKELELYCLDCDLPMCVLCMMKEHLDHDKKTIAEVAEDVADQLHKDQSRIRHAVDEVTKHTMEAKKKVEGLREKKASLETEIRNKHATLVAAADKLRDDALNSLKNVSQDTEKGLLSELGQIQGNLQHLLKLKDTVDKTITNGLDYERATVAKDMRCGAGSPEMVVGRAGQRINTVTRLVLRRGEADDSCVVKKMEEYMGVVVKLERRESLALGKKPSRAVIPRKISSEVR